MQQQMMLRMDWVYRGSESRLYGLDGGRERVIRLGGLDKSEFPGVLCHFLW